MWVRQEAFYFSGVPVLSRPIAVQALAAAKGSQLAIETAVPIGTVLLVAAISALAAYTGQQTLLQHTFVNLKEEEEEESLHRFQPSQG